MAADGLAASLDDYDGDVIHLNAAVEADGLSALDAFRGLKEHRPRAEERSAIIVEGPETIRLLLGSDFEVDGLLTKPSLFAGLRAPLEDRARRLGGFVPVFLCEPTQLTQITGVPAKHAAAALAAARRPVVPAVMPSLSEAIPALQLGSSAGPLRVLALDGGLSEEEVGSLFRVAAAFGVDLVILGSGCGDRFSRLAVRVSMGHVFRVPAASGDLAALLWELRRSHGVMTVAAADAEDAPRYMDELGPMPSRWACAIGPGGHVVSQDVREACELTLALRAAAALGTSIAAGILLHGFWEREKTTTCDPSGR